MNPRHPKHKLTIIGGGIIAALEAYFAYQKAKEKGEQVRVTIYEKNNNLSETTSSNIAPSLTPDEILSVVPRGAALKEKLEILFSKPGGIRVDDVKVENEAAEKFIAAVQEDSKDEQGFQARTKTLLEMGKMSMDLWQNIYDDGDDELKEILKESNFNPCREPLQSETMLHDGYRIDLIYDVANARTRAEAMQKDYEGLGYKHCKVLSPAEVKKLDPFLTDFCDMHSVTTESGQRQWHNDSVALFRPGGCIDVEVFLPKFYAYLHKVMGQYVNDKGQMSDCFHLKFQKHVNNLIYSDNHTISGLKFFNNQTKFPKHQYESLNYVLCPGEAVGTLQKLGLNEPAYAGFAGVSLKLNIEIPTDLIEKYKAFNHCMEVHQEGVVLAWQARFRDNKIFIGVAGTKAFYGDQRPTIDQEFARNRNLLQLNMINDVLPEFISLALKRNTKSKKLTFEDLTTLEANNIAKRWAGVRAVACNFPTLGHVYNEHGKVNNGRTSTHFGSGGVSFGPAGVAISQSIFNNKLAQNAVAQKVLEYSNSSRKI